MPRRNSGARLRFLEKRGCFYIVWTDSGRSRERSTGTSDSEQAQQTLAEFIQTHQRPSGPRDPSQIFITDILADYASEHGPETNSPWRIAAAVKNLVEFWQGRYATDVTRETCRRYERVRGRSAGTVRRELGVLRAAINHAHREGRITRTITVWLPEKPDARERWLTKAEAHALYRSALREPRVRLHLPLFIVLGLYTGQRKEAILSLRWAQVDLNAGLINFNPPGARRSNKRRSRLPIPATLLRRLHRARKRGSDLCFVVHENGQRLKDIKRGFASACHRAGLVDVTPHTLRHTCATWLMQRGVPIWDAAGFLGMSRETIERVYGHHHPDYLQSAAQALK